MAAMSVFFGPFDAAIIQSTANICCIWYLISSVERLERDPIAPATNHGQGEPYDELYGSGGNPARLSDSIKVE